MRSALVLAALLLAPALARAEGEFTVAIDPGHGGVHDGALSPRGVKEKDVSLAVAKELKALLESTGEARVVMTREADDDVALGDRTIIANKAKADVLVSIHCNSMPTKAARKTAMGIETYFLSADSTDAAAHALAARENADVPDDGAPVEIDPISLILSDLTRSQAHADASLFAEKIHRTLVAGVHGKDRGVKQAPFIVLLGAEMPAILVEIGFISHPDEGRKLATDAYRAKIAVALRDAVREFREKVYARRSAPGRTAAVPAMAPAVAVPPITPAP